MFHGSWVCRVGTHIGANGLPRMINVCEKVATRRTAKASSTVHFPSSISAALREKASTSGEIASKKGPVFATAIIAGTMAVKQTSQLIPFCHPLPIEGCTILIEPQHDFASVSIICEVSTTHKT